jgi:hypothetical protein
MFHKRFSGIKRARDEKDGGASARRGGRPGQQPERHGGKRRRNHEAVAATPRGRRDARNHDDGPTDHRRTGPSPNGPAGKGRRGMTSSSSSSPANTKRGGQPPTEEAVALSERLKGLSREKDLDGALNLYWDPANDAIRDGHHACIMIDIAARCGKISVSSNGGSKRI